MTAYRYTGKGEHFLQGVPAMDLSEEDVVALPPEAQAALEAHVEAKGPAFKARKEAKPPDGEKLGEATDPVNPQVTDSDQRTAGGNDTDQDIVTLTGPASTQVPIKGEPEQNPGGVVQSDQLGH